MYKATPVRNLESEAWVPPLDIYLNRWTVKVEQRLERTGIAELLRNTNKKIAKWVKQRRGVTARAPPANSGLTKTVWAKDWLGLTPRKAENLNQEKWTDRDPDISTLRDWKERRRKKRHKAFARRGYIATAADMYDLDESKIPLQLH